MTPNLKCNGVRETQELFNWRLVSSCVFQGAGIRISFCVLSSLHAHYTISPRANLYCWREESSLPPTELPTYLHLICEQQWAPCWDWPDKTCSILVPPLGWPQQALPSLRGMRDKDFLSPHTQRGERGCSAGWHPPSPRTDTALCFCCSCGSCIALPGHGHQPLSRGLKRSIQIYNIYPIDLFFYFYFLICLFNCLFSSFPHSALEHYGHRCLNSGCPALGAVHQGDCSEGKRAAGTDQDQWLRIENVWAALLERPLLVSSGDSRTRGAPPEACWRQVTPCLPASGCAGEVGGYLCVPAWHKGLRAAAHLSLLGQAPTTDPRATPGAQPAQPPCSTLPAGKPAPTPATARSCSRWRYLQSLPGHSKENPLSWACFLIALTLSVNTARFTVHWKWPLEEKKVGKMTEVLLKFSGGWGRLTA